MFSVKVCRGVAVAACWATEAEEASDVWNEKEATRVAVSQ